MPQIDWIPFFAFFFSTTLSPGPNNMASASNGLQHGYRKTMPFIIDIACGFFISMMAIGLISSVLLKYIPQFELILKIVGGSYILWLAYRSLRATYRFKQEDQPSLRFINGFMLQYVNPKVMFFGLTIFTSFLHPLTNNLLNLAVAALLLSGWVFLMNSFWAGAGSVINTYFENPVIKRIFNLVISLMLIYAALNIFGVFDLLRSA
ncbi:MAG TPA: LysE family translocator [Pelolinea sp.]|nr:LysE family translocator [Pelolinea sp.]